MYFEFAYQGEFAIQILQIDLKTLANSNFTIFYFFLNHNIWQKFVDLGNLEKKYKNYGSIF